MVMTKSFLPLVKQFKAHSEKPSFLSTQGCSLPRFMPFLLQNLCFTFLSWTPLCLLCPISISFSGSMHFAEQLLLALGPFPPALCLWSLNFRDCINQAFCPPGCQLGLSQQEPRWEVSVGRKTGSGCFLPCFPPCWVTAGCPRPLTKSYTIFSEFWLCPLLLPLLG